MDTKVKRIFNVQLDLEVSFCGQVPVCVYHSLNQSVMFLESKRFWLFHDRQSQKQKFRLERNKRSKLAKIGKQDTFVLIWNVLLWI